MKYLYCYIQYSEGVNRYLITRESNSNIWIKVGNKEEIISKKTYTRGSGWNVTCFYEETPKLLELYQKTQLQYRYMNHLEKLKSVQDESIMQSVLAIKIPEVNTDVNN